MEATMSQALTAEKRQQILDDLAEGRNGLFGELNGLTEEQWRFKPSPDVWSVSETVEHVVFVENRVGERIHTLKQGAAESGDEALDEQIRSAVRSRNFRAKTPPAAEPSNTLSLADAMPQFDRARAETAALLDQPHPFRGRLQPHPALGRLDGCQWMLAGANHVIRHVSQIRELKNHPDFPRG